MRNICPDDWFLVPGIGKQGGSVKNTYEYSSRNDGLGLIYNASRSILYPENSTKNDYFESVRAEAVSIFNEISSQLEKNTSILKVFFDVEAVCKKNRV
ncbi:MAG: hypothetical protein R3A45_00815 [Bdellovibrionota bacterium]